MKTLREQLEPGASENDSNSLDTCISASVAISLKRIADQLDGGAKGITLHEIASMWFER